MGNIYSLTMLKFGALFDLAKYFEHTQVRKLKFGTLTRTVIYAY